VPAETIVAAIGPCIEVGAFEVGEEVAAQFKPEFVARGGLARPHVDLVGCVRAQLRAAGVPAGSIERVGGCTHSDAGRYFSYRRDGAGIGQMLAFIGFAG
jgi:copper oxidase (laccase) domain-containing protein